jgi:hypothetical protein
MTEENKLTAFLDSVKCLPVAGGEVMCDVAGPDAKRSSRNPGVLSRQIFLWTPSPARLLAGPSRFPSTCPSLRTYKTCELPRIELQSAGEGWGGGVHCSKCDRIDEEHRHLLLKYWWKQKTLGKTHLKTNPLNFAESVPSRCKLK